LSNFYSNWGIC